MNVIFFMEDFDIGGVERVTLQLIKSLVSLHPNVKIKVVCVKSTGFLMSEFLPHTPIIQIDKYDFEESEESVVVFTKGGLSRYYYKFKSKKINIKFTAIQHVPIDLPEKSLFRNFIRKLGCRILYSNMDMIVSVSDGIKDNLLSLDLIKDGNVVTIYNPVLDGNIKILASEAVEHYSDYYVCVGRLHFQKGYDRLIRIVNELNNVKVKIKVLILGDGPEKHALQKCIDELGLEKQIILLGSIPNPYKYISNAKAILLTSRWEGLPTVLVESAYLDTPIISFDCRYGPRELTVDGQFGFIVDDGNCDEFVNRIIDFEHNIIPKIPDVTAFEVNSACNKYVYVWNSLINS